MKTIIALCGLLLLAACGKPSSAEVAAQEKLDAGDVAQIAEAPDGTILWAVKDRGTTVYFASTGTQHRVSSGKTSRLVFTPTAGD